jgi:hypothetical protein
VQALQSGNQLNEALLAADQQLGSLARDRETLRFLTRLALAAGRPDVADRYARRLIDMSARGRVDGESRQASSQMAAVWRRATWRTEAASEARLSTRTWRRIGTTTARSA